MNKLIQLPVGTQVNSKKFGDGVVIGYHSGDYNTMFVQFERERNGLHNGFSNARDSSGKLVKGKPRSCYYLCSLYLDLVETFEGNL